MVVLNYTGEEINAKIVYYGPGLSGKTTNLENLYSHMPADAKGQMVSMKTRTDRTLFFDFFPLELGEISGYRTRFLLYTVPGQVYYNATRKLVLKGADAVVFVADSAPDKLQENIESLRNLEDNLNEHGLSLDDIPWVIQYNKRDVPDAMPVQELHKHLNLMNVPALEAVALTGFGVYDTFKCIAGILYKELKERLESGEGFPQAATGGTETAIPGASPGEGGVDVTDAVDSALREVDTKPATLAKPIPDTPPVQPVAEAPAVQPAQTEHPGALFPKYPGDAEPVPVAPTPVDVSPVPLPPDTVNEQPVTVPHPTDTPASQPEFTQAPPADGQQTPPRGVPAQPVAQQTPPEASQPWKTTETHVGENPVDSVSLPPVQQELSPDVGRLVELDETPNGTNGTVETPPEFITDPMQRSVPNVEPAAEETQEIQEIQMEEGPVVTKRKTEAPDQEISVPVVISRSQVRKTIPITLRLEIRVVDD